MSTTSSAIDYSDLEISLLGLPRPLIEKWLTNFERSNRCNRSELKDDVLYINSDDFIAFLAYVETDKISELELQRLKMRGKQELQRLLFNSTLPEHQYHYKWCLAALQNFEVGRKRLGQDKPEVADKKTVASKVKNFAKRES